MRVRILVLNPAQPDTPIIFHRSQIVVKYAPLTYPLIKELIVQPIIEKLRAGLERINS